ncbi:hypothetical protein MYSTI_04915 [Myxococcus stipitatus DSM 14675]|uniref:PEGA domain-containing protein n=1 Tax=Myxococcus stipitatus (strain DSM 14675 / JCM 12634 / Mx s8) TaxID=1278073 RepID=L7UDR5_MYXSD|nr:hypothetical protein [Myxococcus stipitatus]AGC46203.1 hypothetical protein MYSTI_04915 [Myxococcus stipitatus DSM 14675]
MSTIQRQGSRVPVLTAVVVALWACVASAQRVDAPLEVGGNRPWAVGVPRARQQKAQAYFYEGNERLRESVFVDAARSYKRALEQWNHPAIHYNLALTLMNLDQPIEVYKHLQQAMSHGAEPLDSGRYEHARAYKALLEKQLAWVDVRCDEQGAIVTLNGQPLFTAPGRYQGLIRPGLHSIIAFKDGFLPTEKRQPLMPGEKTELKLELYTEDDVIRYHRRWPAWVPWTVLGSGLAVAGGSGALHWKARESFRDFDARLRPHGARLTGEMTSLRRRGNTLQVGAITGYSVGGAAVVTGAVLLYLNRQRAYRINIEDSAPAVVVAPAVGTSSHGIVGMVRF